MKDEESKNLADFLPKGCVSFSDTGETRALTPEETRDYLRNPANIIPQGCASFSDTGGIRPLTPEETRDYLRSHKMD